MIGIAISVLTIIALPDPITFFAGMVGWGLCFWVAVPRILNRVAEWSLVAEERVGDAQGIMALGRSVGPAAASLLVGHGHFGGLAVFTGVGLAGVPQITPVSIPRGRYAAYARSISGGS